jgi:hypothetical protein
MSVRCQLGSCRVRVGAAQLCGVDCWVGRATAEDGADPTYSELSDCETIRSRDTLIQALEQEARSLGYKRCEVIDIAGETISDGALRTTRIKSAAS